MFTELEPDYIYKSCQLASDLITLQAVSKVWYIS